MKLNPRNFLFLIICIAIVFVAICVYIRQSPIRENATEEWAESGMHEPVVKTSNRDGSRIDVSPESIMAHCKSIFIEAAGLQNRRQKRTKLSALSDELIRNKGIDMLITLRGYSDGVTKEALYEIIAEKVDEGDLRSLLISAENQEKLWLEKGVRQRALSLPAAASIGFSKRVVGILTPEGARDLVFAVGLQQPGADVTEIERAQFNTPSEFDESQRYAFLEGVLAAAEPAVAAEFILRNHEVSLSQDAYSRVASYYAKSHPKEALEWAFKLDSKFSGNAISSATAVWAQTNENSLAEYINTLSPGSTKDRCAAALSQYLLGKGQIEEARNWAMHVEEASLRGRVLKSFPPLK